MSIDQNKTVVRRFIIEVLAGGKLEVVDDVLGPEYSNRAMGADLATFKEVLPALAAAFPKRGFHVEDLVADGDVVVARFSMVLTNTRGETISVRDLTYYRLADGKIVEDEPFTRPDLMQELAKLMPRPAQTE